MTGSGKTLLKITYFILTFLLGILLAVMLPNWFMYDSSMNLIADSLESGQYADAMQLMGGYFKEQPVLVQQVGDGGLVLFEAATLQHGTDEKTGAETVKLTKSHAGFLYGVSGQYQTAGDPDNKTALLVKDGNGNEHTVTLLDYDLDGNGSFDSIASFNSKGFLYIDLTEEDIGSLSQLTFLDKDGKPFAVIDANLNFEGAFYTDVNAFLEEHNENPGSEKLVALDEAFRTKNPQYRISSYGGAQGKAITKSCVIVVLYFLAIYMLYDVLLGRKYLIRGGRWVLEKCGVKFKEKGEDMIDETGGVFGHDYFCQVTMELDTSEAPDFSGNVTVSYSNPESGEISFLLMQADGWTVQKRVHAGIYPNPWIELDRAYEAVDLPENLPVEGYNMKIRIKIKKREGETN